MLKIHQLFLRNFIIIFFIVLVSSSTATYFWSKDVYISQIKKNLTENINIFSVLVKNINQIDKMIRDLKANTNIRITIIDEKGNVIAESDKNKELLENHSNREEVLKAKDFGIGEAIRYSKTLNKELLYVVKKTTINKKIYYIRMADYTDKIMDNFLKLSFQIFAFLAIFLIFAFLTTYLISLKIKKETDAILQFLTQLATKKPSYRLSSTYTQEFYKITKFLNKVASKLEKRNKQKIKQTAKLKVANKQKDEIISALSHEFKNPIAVISGYSETILQDKELPKAMANKFLTKIHSNSQKMSQIIDRLRLTLKLEEEKQEIVLISNSVKKIVENSISDLQDRYKNRDIEILGDDVSLKVDETLFSMAVTNLIENALKYSDEKVVVKIEKDSLSVIDLGIGIQKEELEKVNQKFYRVSHNGWNNSLGLGLFIVQSILSLHHFNLEIKSEYKKGSQFIIKY